MTSSAPSTPRVLVFDERRGRAEAMVAVLHAAGASALVDDGDPRTRRSYLPHVALLLGGDSPSPDPILDGMARVRGADVLRPGEPIARGVGRVLRAAERAMRFEREALTPASELPASVYALRSLAYSATPLRVCIEGDDPVTLELHRGRVFAVDGRAVQEALSHLRGARLRVSPRVTVGLPPCSGFRSLLLEAPVRLRSEVVPKEPPRTGFRAPSCPPGVERITGRR